MHKSCAFVNSFAQINDYFVRCVLIMHWPCAYQRLFAQFCLKTEQTGNNYSKNSLPGDKPGKSTGIGQNDVCIAALTKTANAELVTIDGDF